MGDKTQGITEKFLVERVDGKSEPFKKHWGCAYFVLDLDHDPHAIPAIRAYADSCERDGYAALARDLRDRALDMEDALGVEGSAPPQGETSNG